MTDNFYDEVLIDHVMHPIHRHELCGECCCTKKGINPSCGDEITLHLEVENGIISNGSYTGIGCAVSQASADIMLDLIIGRKTEEALRLKDLFMKMIKGGITDDELEELEEAGALRSIAKMPARVKCAVLGWNTLECMIHEKGQE